jgi:hypothetical protein
MASYPPLKRVCVNSGYSHLLQALQALHPLFAKETADDKGETADNAAAATARLVMACPDGVPLNLVLPVLLSVSEGS